VEIRPPHNDGVEGSVELAIATAIESVSHNLTGRSLDRGYSGEGCKRGI
jgi:hypothetical protein